MRQTYLMIILLALISCSHEKAKEETKEERTKIGVFFLKLKVVLLL